MEFLFAAAAIAIAFWLVYAVWTKMRQHARLERLKSHESYFHEAIQAFNNYRSEGSYFTHRASESWKARYAFLLEDLKPPIPRLHPKDPLIHGVRYFLTLYQKSQEIIDFHNDRVLEAQTPVIKQLLDARGIKNNPDQLKAIACDEDRILLVAGAGTGKTTTVLGKVCYLLELRRVRPEEILLLSFTRQAAGELAERVEQQYQGLAVRTFNSFGLSIIGDATGHRPMLAFPENRQQEKFIEDLFARLRQDPQYLALVIEYFSYYLRPIAITPSFKTLDEYYQYTRSAELLTFQKETVKSQQELMIANFLYLNNIRYIYEHPYKYDLSDKKHAQYRPDFYLPDYDLYLEHFGIDRSGMVHFSRDMEQNRAYSEKYRAGMDWKRRQHRACSTTLIETYSYEFTEGNWKELITQKLATHRVAFAPREQSEVLEAIRESDFIYQMSLLFHSFLNLSKSKAYTLERLREKIAARRNPRERAFFALFAPIYEHYEAALKERNRIDFHDMLLRGADCVRQGRYRSPFRYIIIDEFQDFSVSRYQLVRALLDQSPATKVFCVGDDWQSIFRFTGSDIALMTNFEHFFGFTKRLTLVITNRFNNKIAGLSNRFVLANPHQIRKEVTSTLTTDAEVLKIIPYHNNRDAILTNLLEELDHEAEQRQRTFKVLLLGRYNYTKPTTLPGCPHLRIEFLTVHSAKGLEGDIVILLDVQSGKYGFPSEISDDPILEIALSESDLYPHAEERRLFYVALTRAKERIYILTDEAHRSAFVEELESGRPQPSATPEVRCKECGGAMVLRKSEFGPFYGCNNYPQCQFTLDPNKKTKTTSRRSAFRTMRFFGNRTTTMRSRRR
ncbi:MAG: UvrD-helicase domain-containing protein [bacterium]|nr:UvrD-helicase domain-containing protein [bacterium]